jgi:hypothetical protein
VNIYSLIYQAIELTKTAGGSLPALETNKEYMLVYTEDLASSSLKNAKHMDVEKVYYYSETVNLKTGIQELIFMDIRKDPIAVSEDEYGSKWIALRTTSPIGLLMKEEHANLSKAIENQIPHNLKGKIIIK